MTNWITKHKELLVFLLYAFATFSLLFYHENWRDEAQTWLLARDCTIPELIDAMKYEGHFLLWYFILMPFAKAGFPYFTTNIISWLITCVAVWLILYKAPFDFDKRVLLIFTFPLLYLFPVVSRCYCLIPLATVLMSIFYKDRKEKPLRYLLSIVLLLNTHVIMAGMVAVVFIGYIIELHKRWKDLPEHEKQMAIVSIIIAVVLMLASIYPLLGCLTVNKEIQTGGNLALQISEAIFHCPVILLKGLFLIKNTNEMFYYVILIITIITLFFEVRISPLGSFSIFLSLLWQCLIYSSIFGPSLQRMGTIIFIVLFFKWKDTYNNLNRKTHLNNVQNKIRGLCWSCLVLFNIISGLLFLKFYELPCNYSNAHEMANYINKQLHDNSVILGGSHVEYLSSIIPFVEKDIKFYSVPGERFFTYAIWNNTNQIDVNYEEIKKLPLTFHNNEKLYYIFCPGKSFYYNVTQEIKLIDKMTEKKIFKKLYCTDDVSIASEYYTIYEVRLDDI